MTLPYGCNYHLYTKLDSISQKAERVVRATICVNFGNLVVVSVQRKIESLSSHLHPRWDGEMRSFLLERLQ